MSRHHAVQTLSRLNRIHPGKDETFVLDFVNDAEAIQDAYQEYYDKTVSPAADPNLMYDALGGLDPFGVLRDDEVKQVVELIVSGNGDLHKKVHAVLKPAIDRYEELDEKPIQTLAGIYEALELGRFESVRPAFEKYLSELGTFEKNRFEFPADAVEVVNRRWGFALDAFGYKRIEPGQVPI